MEELIAKAFKARENSYSPYSNYSVGAALLTKDCKIFLGTNVENASYGATICAERSAFINAINSGITKFEAIAIVGGTNTKLEYAYPCGICRQVMQEFCEPSFKIIIAKSITDFQTFTLNELLPYGFGEIGMALCRERG